MPLTQMADHVDGVEKLKAYVGYGLPKMYPLALNGFFGVRKPQRGVSGMGRLGSDFEGLGCGADCPCSSCSKNMHGMGYFGSTVPLTEAEQADIELGVVVPRSSGPAQPQGPQTPLAQNVQSVANTIVSAWAQLAPAFKRAPRPKVVVQKEAPDNTVTYAVIGGAVIVASVLAIAVGKSGRKKS